MSQLPTYLGLPQAHNGRMLSYLLIASTVVSLLAVGLTAPSAGFWQFFLTITAGPLIIIHHITIFCLLRKHKTHAHVHECLTRRTNIGFLVLFEATLIAGVGVGLYFYTWLKDSSDDNYPPLALVSTLFALLECLVLAGVILYCIVARREKLMDMREPDETRL